MKPNGIGIMGLALLALAAGAPGRAADDKVATAVYAKIGNGYQRERLKDGSFKPEHYALSNGGRIYATTADLTVERVTYPQVAEIAMRLLAQQNFHYAQSKEQAKLLIVLQWGNTIAVDTSSYTLSVNAAASAYADLVALTGVQGPGRGFAGSQTRNADGSAIGQSDPAASSIGQSDPDAPERFEAAMLKVISDNRVRDQINERNARVLGYLDDLADSNDIRRWAGGGDRYNDLIQDVEESRYYIMISAYDFAELQKTNQKKLLWQTRVSVRSPGNAFDDSLAAMMKSASRYFGRESGQLVRGEETKGTVELGDLKYMGEAKVPEKTPTKGNK